MEGNTEVSRPAPVEVLRKPERLLNKETTGAQALMILGVEPSKAVDKIILNDTQKDNIRRCNETGIPSGHKEKINKASFNEREEYWENRKDIKKEERMNEWKRNINSFLDVYKKDATKAAEQKFLKNILGLDAQKSLDEVNADSIYATFMKGDGKGDVDFFAKRIVTTNTFDEIDKNQNLIRNLGNLYGKNSAKISELLTYGRTNVREDSEAFIRSAQENLGKRSYGEEVIWTELDKNSKRWEENENKKKEAEAKKKEDEEKRKKAEEDKKRQEETERQIKQETEKQKEQTAVEAEGVEKDEQNKKKIETVDVHSLKEHGLSDAYEFVTRANKDQIKREWRAHPNLEIQTSNEPVIIDENVINDYNDLVVQQAKATNNEVPFNFIMNREKNRIVKLFVGEGTSSGSVGWDYRTPKAKEGLIFNTWATEQKRSQELYDGTKGKYMVGIGHTHPASYGPVFSNVGSDFGYDYGATFRLWKGESAFGSHHGSNIHLLGAPYMGLLGAIEAKENGVVVFHPIRVSATETSSQQKIDIGAGESAKVEEELKIQPEKENVDKEEKTGAENTTDIKDNKGELDKYVDFKKDVRETLHLGAGRHAFAVDRIEAEIRKDKEKLPVFINVMEQEVEKAQNLDSLNEIFNDGWDICQGIRLQDNKILAAETNSNPLLANMRRKTGIKVRELIEKNKSIPQGDAKKTINNMFLFNESDDLDKIIDKLIAG